MSFDITGGLPAGVAVLEASAGTGKTFTIAALAARYVAEGIPIEELLVVTFTRAATGELRERVRERLVTLERALATGETAGDALAAHLRGNPAAHRRLVRALADFDAATITTTHGFCREALGALGFAGDSDRDQPLEEEVPDLEAEVVDDLYLRKFFARIADFPRSEAGKIARAAIANPSAHLEPADAPADTIAGLRLSLAHAVRQELDRRKRAGSVLTYDDLLTRLKDALERPGGEEIARRLADRYAVVLVDEFQDTDPVQWAILQRAFAGRTLVLIGDPKQAIYAFRGADVHAYIDAKRTATTRDTLGTNWRSDGDLLRAYDVLFGDAPLGHPDIPYRSVQAAPDHAGTRLSGAPFAAPLRIRVLPQNSPEVKRTPRGYVKKDSARELIVRDLVADVVRLLESGARAAGERVAPGHIAVLVRRNRDAAAVRDALEAAGVPAVEGGAGSVFAADGAAAWLTLLEALERPGAAARAHALALTPFLGWSAARVAQADEATWSRLHARLHGWAAVLRDDGVAALLETITAEEGLPARVLAVREGERVLSDLRHVGQLLHAAAVSEHLGTAALTGWLRHRIAQAAQEADEERSRRLESDADAVQVLTIHRAKGLEFPLVYCPFLWDASWVSDEPEPIFFHDPDHGDRRTLDVGLEGPRFAAHQRRHREEQRGEDLRLAYVALTRARHQAIVWWPRVWGADGSPFGRLVFGRGADGAIGVDGAGLPSDAEARARFAALAALAPGCIGVEDVDPGLGHGWRGERVGAEALAAARFTRRIDRDWRRTSYSDITALSGHEAAVSSEPETGVVDDEPVEEELVAPASGLAGLPGGTRVGTLVHEILQDADFAAPDLAAELRARVAAGLARRRVELDGEVLAAGLHDALDTPLGPLAGGLPLRGIARADRLDELAFELALAGGDAGGAAAVSPRAIAAVLRAHLPADDPLAAYADRLEDPALRAGLRGYLTGSIDLVWRLPGGRFAVVDYKTNRLGAVTLADYAPGPLREEMLRSHYALQALLYTVALHRYLRWRLPAHDPDRDLAGVLYLFLRGMAGPATPESGVFAWRPPPGLVVALSDLLDEGER